MDDDLKLTRRDVIIGTALVACGTDQNVTSPDAGIDVFVPPPDANEPQDAAVDVPPTPQCIDTEDDDEGPFYKAGAPVRNVLATAATAGVPLTVRGKVMGRDCKELGNALLDVWQADATGTYDNTGYEFRGQFNADADGNYEFVTIIPGRYLNGPSVYRPQHIHIKVSAPGHILLTTQLYFDGDPWNAVDSLFKPSLVMKPQAIPDAGVTEAGDTPQMAVFDFVLAQ